MHSWFFFIIFFKNLFLLKIIFWLLRSIWIPGVHCILVFFYCLSRKKLIQEWYQSSKGTWNSRALSTFKMLKRLNTLKSQSVPYLFHTLDRVATLAGKAGMAWKAGVTGKAGKEYHFQSTFCQRLEFDILLRFILIFCIWYLKFSSILKNMELIDMV